jgi:CRISPR/Cas system-associated endoribonuclease Cas2
MPVINRFRRRAEHRRKYSKHLITRVQKPFFNAENVSSQIYHALKRLPTF